MKLHFELTVPTPPWAAWRALTWPEFMNAWSTAPIELVRHGDGRRPDTVGAQRVVRVPTGRGTQRLEEVIEASEPPHHLVYRVVDSPPLAFHRGEIRIEPTDGGSRITWEVTARFMLPGLDLVARPLLQRELSRSLRALPGCCAALPDTPLPAVPAPEDEQVLDDLYDAAERTLDEQRRHAAELTSRNDPRRWFPIVYQYVTEEQIRRCRAGQVQMPGWTLRLIPVFHRYYYDENFVPWSEGRPMDTGRHWVRAFQTMENERLEPAVRLFAGLRRAIIAHIEEDLPRALAETWWRWYRGRCAYERYRADYLLMGDVFSRAASRAAAEIPPQYIPVWARLVQRATPQTIQDQLQHQQFYNIPKQRRRTFERGRRITETWMLLDADSSS